MRPDFTLAIRARLIAAMEQRATALGGAARRALNARLAELRALDAGAPDEGPQAHATPVQASRLRELVEPLARHAAPGRATYPEVPALADFRQLWSTLRADSQLQQSVAPTSIDAGPLNSTALAGRAIALMGELSPAYLRSFITYLDELAWLKQLESPGPGAGSATPKKRAPRKRHAS